MMMFFPGNKIGKIVGLIVPIMFIVLTVKINVEAVRLGAELEQTKTDLTKFEELSADCIEPLDIYVQPLDLSINTASVARWVYEPFIILIVGLVYYIAFQEGKER